MGDKNDCPICFEEVKTSNPMNCYQCMTCHQKIHGTCELKWNTDRIPQANRFLRDDILICPVCKGNSIAFCNDTETDINRDRKEAVAKNPDRRGGKILQQKSHKFSKKTRKSGKTKKTKKTRKTRKTRKSKRRFTRK